MVNDSRAGRHRPATPYNPLAEVSTILRGAGETGVKASAVLAASGGLVATFALPAQASPSAAAAVPGSAASAAPAVPTPVDLPPALVAPEHLAPVAPVALEAVGVAGVTAVAKPKPAPRPSPVVQEAVRERTTASSSSTSRSTSRPSAAPVAQSSSEIVNIARTLLGIAYVYGGTTPAGFDCSGFTSYVFAKAGISIPRTASAQQAAATPVSDPRPGDLVFYGSPAWHVGIYTGNGMMIDSPRPGKYTSERALFSGVTGYGRF